METYEIIMAMLGTAGLTALSTGYVFKSFLENGIEASISSAYKKQSEEHKHQLKNSEKVFEYKLEASKILYKILRDIQPKQSHPRLDWSDVCEEIVSRFSKHEATLDEFLCEYQATLSPAVLKRLRRAVISCADGQFELYWDLKAQDPKHTKTAIDKANELYESLNEAVDMLRNEVHVMISTQSN